MSIYEQMQLHFAFDVDYILASVCTVFKLVFLCARELADIFNCYVPCDDCHVLGWYAKLKAVQLLKKHLETPVCSTLLQGTSPQNMKMAFKAWITRMIGNPLLLHLHMGQEAW